MDEVTSSLGKAFEWEKTGVKLGKAEAEVEQLERQIKEKLGLLVWRPNPKLSLAS